MAHPGALGSPPYPNHHSLTLEMSINPLTMA